MATRRYVNRQISASKELVEQQTEHVAENIAFDGAAVWELSKPANNVTSGDKSEIVKSDFRMRFSAASAAGATFVRVLIIQWYKDSNVALPTAADVIQGTLDLQSFMAPLDYAQHDNNTTFKLVKDFVIRLGESTATDGSDKVYRRVLITPKMVGRKYLRGTATQQGMNMLYAVVISDIADASTPPTGESQVSFHYKGESN